MTASWVVEAMSTCNAILAIEEQQQQRGQAWAAAATAAVNPERPGVVWSLERQLEMAEMADLLYNRAGKFCFSFCMCLYLYGDLAIYCTVVAKSLRDVTCLPLNNTHSSLNNNSSVDDNNSSANNNSSNSDYGDICWSSSSISRLNAFRIYVACFICLLGPFTFFRVTKTKYLQLATTLLRWTAFSLMMVLSIRRLVDSSLDHGHPPLANWSALPAVFGTSVYAFMCHHSIPSLVSPMKNSAQLSATLAADYALIAGFYLLLAFTGIFAFPALPDLYTLAFAPDRSHQEGVLLEVIDYFLNLFPVFTLSTNFPIIAITLRNNLEVMVTSLPGRFPTISEKAGYVVFPLLALVPAALIALATEDVGILVTITGAYAGAGIQYVIPVSHVWLARRRLAQLLGEQPSRQLENPFRSVFRHTGFLVGVLAWCGLAIALVSINFALQTWYRPPQ
jgi:amino acid permease